MKTSKIQLMIHGDEPPNINRRSPTILGNHHPGQQLPGEPQLSFFADLVIAMQCRPGQLTIRLTGPGLESKQADQL